jgi:hypothetical protein
VGLNANESPNGLFDIAAIRDTTSLETKVIHDWRPSTKDPSIRQKLVEITVCEWWPGQRVRIPVTLNAPAEGPPCENILVINMGMDLKSATRKEFGFLEEYGFAEVLQPANPDTLRMK